MLAVFLVLIPNCDSQLPVVGLLEWGWSSLSLLGQYCFSFLCSCFFFFLCMSRHWCVGVSFFILLPPHSFLASSHFISFFSLLVACIFDYILKFSSYFPYRLWAVPYPPFPVLPFYSILPSSLFPNSSVLCFSFSYCVGISPLCSDFCNEGPRVCVLCF